jgi:hypothetical protein
VRQCLQSFGMRKVLLLYTACVEQQYWTLTAVLEHQEVWMVAFVEFVPEEKCLKSFSCMTTRQAAHVCALVGSVWTVLPYPPHSLSSATLDFHRFGPSKDTDGESVDFVHQWLQRQSDFYRAGMHAVTCWRRLLTKMETLLKNNSVFRNLVKFCGIFRCPNLHVAWSKNMSHCIVTAPHIFVHGIHHTVVTAGSERTLDTRPPSGTAAVKFYIAEGYAELV